MLRLSDIIQSWFNVPIIVSDNNNRLTGFGFGDPKLNNNLSPYTVTNLNNSGSGSLRDAVSVGERYITFAIAGNIELSGPITIAHDHIVIDGSTAPYGGVCLKNYGITLSASHVLVKHIRIRRGDTPFVGGESGDCLLVTGGSNIWIDHVSLSFSIDELFNFWGTSYATISNSLLVLPLSHSINHPEGYLGHGYGILIGHDAHHLTVYNTLIAHCEARVPLIGDTTNLQYINCFHYNTKNNCISLSGQEFMVVNNNRKSGPDTLTSSDSLSRYALAVWDENVSLYQKGNLCDKRPNDNLDETLGIYPSGVSYTTLDVQPNYPYVVIRPTDTLLNLLLNEAGATLPKRDSLDTQVINDIINGTGNIIDSPDEVGGWPDLTY